MNNPIGDTPDEHVQPSGAAEAGLRQAGRPPARRSRWFCPTTLLVVIYLGSTALFVHASLKQLTTLNIHPVAGGQMPYLAHAAGIHAKGLGGFRDDRNRMPFVPWLVSWAYDPDPQKFGFRAAWVALAISLASILVIGVAAHLALPRWPAAIATLTGLFALLPDKATFLGAEVPFYALFFFSGVLFVRLLARPSWRVAALAGVVAALAYYTKASILPLVGLYGIFAVFRAVSPAASPAADPDRPAARRRALASAGVALAGFLAAVSPYIAESHERFGRFFFNVNADIVMWCDSWRQAHPELQRLDEAAWRQRGWADFPGPGHYLRNHSTTEIVGRLTAGWSALLGVAARSLYGWVVGAAAVAAVFVTLRHRAAAGVMLRRHALPAVFIGSSLVAYLLLYGWYVKVAFGDRFVQSLVLPALAGLLALITRVEHEARPDGGAAHCAAPRSRRWAMVAAGALAVIGGWSAHTRATAPNDTFVPFFHQECQALMGAHREELVTSCFEAVLALDPDYGPANLSLGMWLMTSNPRRSEGYLRRAAELMPRSGEPWNLLGFNLDRQGRRDEAWEAFRSATLADPEHRDAWLNFGSVSLLLGRPEDAANALRRLEALAAPQAATLRARIEWSAREVPDE